ncbi:hypothetical protein JL720_5362 [Aureococcus anophagefferens]|nr:hypothetical protein JL720_5362 [Aureococcus anophagefferens]
MRRALLLLGAASSVRVTHRRVRLPRDDPRRRLAGASDCVVFDADFDDSVDHADLPYALTATDDRDDVYASGVLTAAGRSATVCLAAGTYSFHISLDGEECLSEEDLTRRRPRRARADAVPPVAAPTPATPAPTYTCRHDPAPHVCWGHDASGVVSDDAAVDAAVDAFDCDLYTNPVQVLRAYDADAGDYAATYSVVELNLETGDYDNLYDLDFADGKKYCFNASLTISPNVGAVVGHDYFYAKNPGKGETGFLWVSDVHTDAPVFHADPLFVVADDLYEAQVLDVAPLEETGYSFVDDGDGDDGSYLVGLGQGFEVLVVRVVDGAPAEYAVLESDVDWADYDDGYGDVPFGAGFTYRNPANTEARVFFVANEGFGVEVALPLTVSDDCWNSGSQTSYHEICSDRSTVSWRVSSVETAYNDGFNCPENTRSYLFTTAEPTYAPTAGPSAAPSGAPAPLPTPEPCLADACWDDAATGLFDCEDGGAPLVARREYDATIQDSPRARRRALFDGGDLGFYVFAAVGGSLCRVDEDAAACVDDPLLSSPDAAAIVGSNFYYAEDLGDDGAAIYWVEAIHTDWPTVHDDTFLEVAAGLFDGTIGDLAPVEDPGGYVSDDAGAYLFGLSSDFKVLVAKLHPSGAYPTTYVVLPGAADWGGYDADEDDESAGGFGAAFSYLDGGSPKVFFAASNGDGFFEVVLPIAIPDDCWNSGGDDGDFCDDADDVLISRRGAADALEAADGLNCPEYDLFDTAAPSAAPTTEPCDDDVCWEDRSIDGIDCGAAETPLRASATALSELHYLDEAYGTLFGIDYVVESAVGAALFDGGSAGYVPFAVLDGALCRFDDAKSVCFDGGAAPGAAGAAIVGTTLLRARPGRLRRRGHPHGRPDLRDVERRRRRRRPLRAVGPRAVVEPDDDDAINDGEAGAAYLLGLGADFSVLIVRLDASGAPSDYAVVPGTVDDGAAGAAFGAAHAYEDESGATRALFVDDGGQGVYEVLLPITVSFDCWYASSDAEACGTAATVLKADGADDYSLVQIDVTTGALEALYDLTYVDGKANAVGLFYDLDDELYVPMGVMDERLCRFDATHYVCFEGDLVYPTANAGALVGANFYYSKNPGDGEASFYWVEDVRSDYPVFHNDDAGFVVSDALFTGKVLDVAPIDEVEYGGVVVDDGAEARYLVGVGQAYEVVVVRLADDGAPDAYAVLGGDVVTGLDDATAETSVGAVWTYYDAADDGAIVLVASSNDGFGVFRLDTPFAVPDACWNSGDDVDDHVACADSGASGYAPVAIAYVVAADAAASNDGMNCPVADLSTAPPSAAPTESCATRKTAVCWADGGVAPFGAMRFDLASGTYGFLFALDYFDGDAVNGAGLLEIGGAAYAMAAFDDRLCRFDGDGSLCFDGALAYDYPNVAAVVGTTYYYSKSPGKNDKSFYFVENVHTDDPVFVDDAAFVVSPDLFSSSLGDVVPVVERDGAASVVDDGEDYRTYLVGLGRAFEVVVVRLDADGRYPEAYAVLASAVDWGAYNATLPDDSAFGAGFGYELDTGENQVFFANNDGFGIFEVELPLAVPSTCWNAGSSTAFHALCSATAAVTRRTDAAAVASNDGFNCAGDGGSPIDTMPPTVAPTLPCAEDPGRGTCWADASVAPWDCGAYPYPVQGTFDVLYHMTYASRVNAVDLFDGGDAGFYAMGNVDGQLCRFDADGAACLNGDLVEPSANAGTVLSTSSGWHNYYYARNLGDGAQPVYWMRGATLVDDGDDADDAYLFGLGGAFEVFVVQLDRDTGAPAAYAVLPSAVDWGTYANASSDGLAFGAAFTYEDPATGGVACLFAENGGAGMFRLEFPIAVPASCWNTGADGHVFCDGADDVAIARAGFVSAAASNDGMNCPNATGGHLRARRRRADGVAAADGRADGVARADGDADDGRAHGRAHGRALGRADRVPDRVPTASPSASRWRPRRQRRRRRRRPRRRRRRRGARPRHRRPSHGGADAHPAPAPTSVRPYAPMACDAHDASWPFDVCWSDRSVGSFNCSVLSNRRPLQVLQESSDGDVYEYGLHAEITTGDYEHLWTLPTSTKVNAVAMLLGVDGGAEGDFMFASFGGEFCRFDEASSVCVGELAEPAANAAAILGPHYYYAANPGDGASGIYYVEWVTSDAPTIHADPPLTVAAGAVSGAVLDVAPLFERNASQVLIDDGVAGAYVVGLGPDFDVLVIRINKTTNAPESYAVLQSAVDWAGAPEVYDGATSFGAIWTYKDYYPIPQIYAASNDGWGIFKLALPLAVPAACWNYGDSSDGVKCNATANVSYVGASKDNEHNDGLNCVNRDDHFARATAAPTPGLRRLDATAAPTCLKSFYVTLGGADDCNATTGETRVNGVLEISLATARCDADLLEDDHFEVAVEATAADLDASGDIGADTYAFVRNHSWYVTCSVIADDAEVGAGAVDLCAAPPTPAPTRGDAGGAGFWRRFRRHVRRGDWHWLPFRIEAYFATLDTDFELFDGEDPVVTATQCFDDLNIPPEHPGRSKSDTYYLTDELLLRTHTSAHQSEHLRGGHEAFLCTGDVYRRDEIDASHFPAFHQMEGVKLFDEAELGDDLVLGREAWLESAGVAAVGADLKRTLEGMIRAVFDDPDLETRWRDDFFPFTEPSFELDVFYQGEWLEVLGCGVIH